MKKSYSRSWTSFDQIKRKMWPQSPVKTFFGKEFSKISTSDEEALSKTTERPKKALGTALVRCLWLSLQQK